LRHGKAVGVEVWIGSKERVGGFGTVFEHPKNLFEKSEVLNNGQQ